VCGGMGVKVESEFIYYVYDHVRGLADFGRSKEDIEKRLDALIEEIKEIQRPYMDGNGAGDVVLVCQRRLPVGVLTTE
jgi:hypothetical protein